MMVFVTKNDGTQTLMDMNQILDPEGLGWKKKYQQKSLELKEQANQISQQKANNHGENIQRLRDQNSLDHIFKSKFGAKYATQAVEDYPKLRHDVQNDKQLIGKMKELKRLYEENPEIFTSPVLMKALNSKEPGIWDTLVKNNPFRDKEFAGNASYAIKLLQDLHTNRIQVVSANGQRVTVPIVEVIIKSLANPALTQDGALKSLNHELGYIEESFKLKQEILQGYQLVHDRMAEDPMFASFIRQQQTNDTQSQDKTSNLIAQPEAVNGDMTENVTNPITVGNENTIKLVKVRDPKSKKEHYLSEEDAQIAIDAGGIKVEEENERI
jgi:hypothetical protein